MQMDKQVNIAGQKIAFSERPSENLKGINVGEKIAFNFYDGSFRGVDMLFVEPKRQNPTPRNCQMYAGRFDKIFGLPVIFLLHPAPAYERERLLQKNIFFVMSDKYANLPMLVALERVSNRKTSERITPVAQYILLYHLQIDSLENMSAKEIAKMVPYSYESVTLGISCLEDLGLAEKIPLNAKSKAIHFEMEGKELWDKAQPLLLNPIEKTIYCDGIDCERDFTVCGINALSHYSHLNPDREQWIMTSAREYREMINSGELANPNEFDGNIILEVWKYPPVAPIDETPQWVDKLSLVLSLQDDHNPRVEKEVEYIIDTMQW